MLSVPQLQRVPKINVFLPLFKPAFSLSAAIDDAAFLLGFGYPIGLTKPTSVIALRHNITLIIQRRWERGGVDYD